MESNQDPGSHFLGLSKLFSPQGLRDIDMKDEEELPKELSTLNCSHRLLRVSSDKLSVQYKNFHLQRNAVGVVKANCPAPVKRLVYYFEIFVKNAGTNGKIAVGFTLKNSESRIELGWEDKSYGYHGDGLLYCGQRQRKTFGPTFTSGDTVGGGINYAAQDIFFTKNGLLVGTVFNDVKGPLIPTISVHNRNEEVDVNFGQKPFTFDIKVFALEERLKQQLVFGKILLPQNVSYRIVRSYLLHHGYEDTLNSFDMESTSMLPPISVDKENDFTEQGNMYALSHRKTLRQLIKRGHIDSAFGKLRDWYPQVVQDDKSTICFLLHCQKFIELVRVEELEEAVKYGTIELEKFYALKPFDNLLQDCAALLAYEAPMQSMVGYLLHTRQQEIVADAVNAMVLLTNPNLQDSQNCLHSHLEMLLRQLTACCLEKRFFFGDEGEAFNLQTVLER